MNIAELISKLAASVGIETSDQGLVNILSNSEITKVSVPEAISNKLLNGLLTVEAAKNNPDIKSHYVAQALNGVDEKVNAALDILGFDEEAKSKILGEKNTYNRIQLLSDLTKSKIEAIKAAKANGAKTEDVEKLRNEIIQLNNEMSQLKDSHKSEIESLGEQHNENILKLNIRGLLSGKKYATDSLKIDKSLILDSAQKAVLTALEAKGAMPILDGNNEIKLVRKDNPEMPFMEANQVVNFNDVMNAALAENNLLAVSNPQNPTPPGGGIPPASKEGMVNSDALESIDAQLAALGAN